MTRWILLFAAAAMLAAAAAAQNAPSIVSPRDPDSSLLIRNATVVTGPGQQIEHGVVLIIDGRIVAVGATVPDAPGVREIDAEGLFLYAGFVDGMARAGLVESRQTEADERRVESDIPSPAEGPWVRTVEANRHGIFARRRVEDLLDIRERTFDSQRQAGFTAALLAPPRAPLGGAASVVALGERPLRSSLVRSGVGQMLSWSAPRDRAMRIRGRYPQTVLGTVAHLRQVLLDARWWKEQREFAVAHPDAMLTPPADPDLEALQVVLRGELPLLVEADSADEIERAIRLADEFGVRVVIVGGAEAGDRAQLLRQRGIAVVLGTALPAEPRKFELLERTLTRTDDDRTLYGKNWGQRPFWPERAVEEAKRQRERRARTAADLEAAGVTWCVSTTGRDDAATLHDDLHEMVKAGLSADALLRALTITPARLMGVEGDVGGLERGRRGSVVGLTKALGTENAAVRLTVVDGVLYEFDVREGRSARDGEGEGSSEGRPGRRGGRRGQRPAPEATPDPAVDTDPAPAPDEPSDEPPSEPSDEPTDEPAEPKEGDAPAADEPSGRRGRSRSADSAPATRPAVRPLTHRPSISSDILLHKPDWALETPEDRRPRLRTGGNVLLRNAARVITLAGDDLLGASVLVRDGRIAAVGRDLAAPDGTLVVDATGCVILPGVIDPHSHIALETVNEFSASVTPEVRCSDVIEHDDPSIFYAAAGGCTTIHAMHGSANTIGGQCVQMKMKYGLTRDELLVPDQVRTVKWALGENVKRPGMSDNRRREPDAPLRFPGTRMGVETTMRRALDAGREYAAARVRANAAAAEKRPLPPLRRDLRLEALADILEGNIWVNTHCYRADEILRLMDVAEEYGIRIAVLHHVLEGYRIIPEIVRHGAGTATFADWWAYKVEAFDATPWNAAMLQRAGVNSALKSDSGDLMRHMHLEAAKSIRYAGVSDHEALQMITINAARQFGLEKRLGTIEPGKEADLAVFNGHPLNTFARCELTLIDGEVYFQHRDFEAEGGARRAQSAEPPKAPAAPAEAPVRGAQTYAIVNGTVHTMAGPVIERGTVVISGGRIAAVGAGAAVPDGAVVVDAAGLHVYPGMINAATQVGLVEIEAVGVTIDTAETGAFQPDLLAVSGFNPHSATVEVTRADGITSVLLVASAPTIAGQAGLIDLDGWTMTEMLREPRAGLVVNLPVTRARPMIRERARPRGEEREPREESGDAAVSELARFFAAARLYADRAAGAPGGRVIDARFEALIPYVRGEKPVLFSTNSYQAILEALLFAEQTGLRPVILGGQEAWKVADLLAARSVPVIHQGVFSMPRGLAGVSNVGEAWDANYRSLSVLAEKGVKFCVASRGADLAKTLPLDVGFAVAHGLDPEAAMRCLTISAAEILGVDRDVGSLEVGKVANLIVTTDHPCQGATQVRHVFVRGQPVAVESKHSREASRFGARPDPQLPPARPTLSGPPSQSR